MSGNTIMIITGVIVNALYPSLRVEFMHPTLPIRYNRQKLDLYNNPFFFSVHFLSLIVLAVVSGCGKDEKASGRERIKPEGLVLIVRELDLGKLPVGASMEAVLSAKNPSIDKSYSISRYEIDRPGFAVEPNLITIGPGETGRITFKISPEATKEPGSLVCNISAIGAANELIFRTTLRLNVAAPAGQ